MQKVFYIITDGGDGTQSLEWYKGSQFTEEQLIQAAEAYEYDSYQSGDGVQIRELRFPDSFDLDSIEGIYWRDALPGAYK